jgi:anti-sigma factor ChrR (cupin superfamily)
VSSDKAKASCAQVELVSAHALGAVPEADIAAIEAHIAVCLACREEFDSLRAVTATLASWPADVLEPTATLWGRLIDRVSQEAGTRPEPSAVPDVEEPSWEQVAPGISCKLLATDFTNDRVSMLVRLAPGADYPPHTHAGVEELHLLDGELYIDDRKLYPGDYSRAEPGSGDRRVWSETGCTCVLITSTRDQLT